MDDLIAGLMKTIVWDIDDVLNDLTRTWFERVWQQENKGTTMRYSDLRSNPPHDILGIAREDYLLSLDAFRLSSGAATMMPEPAVVDWFHRSGHHYRHLALTARPIGTFAAAVQWLYTHFGSWFQAVSIVPSPRTTEHPHQPDSSKGAFLAWLGKADFFIDDHAAQVQAATALGIQAYLVKQPWNNSSATLTEILDAIDLVQNRGSAA